MVHGGNRVLPDQRLLRNQRTQIARDRPHVTVGQLEPRPRKRVCKLIRMLIETPRNLFVGRVEPQGEVRGQHGWRMTLSGIVRIRHRTVASSILRRPLMGAGRALGKFPFIAEQVGEEVVAPLRRSGSPDDFQSAADRVAPKTLAQLILPSQTLILDVGSFWIVSYILRGNASAVGFAEAV